MTNGEDLLQLRVQRRNNNAFVFLSGTAKIINSNSYSRQRYSFCKNFNQNSLIFVLWYIIIIIILKVISYRWFQADLASLWILLSTYRAAGQAKFVQEVDDDVLFCRFGLRPEAGLPWLENNYMLHCLSLLSLLFWRVVMIEISLHIIKCNV